MLKDKYQWITDVPCLKLRQSHTMAFSLADIYFKFAIQTLFVILMSGNDNGCL